jgi:addiction module HigA family antidote
MTTRKLSPVHPGEVLQVEFLEPLGLSQNRLASGIGVPARRINEIVLGKRRVSADTALRLGRYFDTTPQFWLGRQTDFDLDVVSDELGDRLDREVRAPTAAT